MTTVTVAEARENLVELLRRAAGGEQIVITEDGKWLAALGQAPPPPPTPEEEAARRRLLEEFERNIARWHEEDGLPYPPAAFPVASGPEDEAAVLARREQLIREWLQLRSDAPVPKPDTMSHEEYLTRYRKAG